jgi:hypothetical protein
MKIIYYSVLEWCDSRYKLPGRHVLDDKIDAACVADLAAENFFHFHDGWDSCWPLTFILYHTETGPEFGRYSIALDFQPYFHATHLTEKK